MTRNFVLQMAVGFALAASPLAARADGNPAGRDALHPAAPPLAALPASPVSASPSASAGELIG